MKKGKVILVGTGFVGMSMAYSMLNRGGIIRTYFNRYR